jgi:parvulin-like peptidyl-prolyl isomerase
MINDLRLNGVDPVRSAVHNALILPMAKQEGISISDAELQEAADRFRQNIGLRSKDSTIAWLESNGLTVDDLERNLEKDKAADKLMQRVITNDDVEAYFNEYRLTLDWAQLSQIVVGDEGLANTLYQQLTDTGTDFDELARTNSEDESRDTGGYLGKVSRQDLTPEAGSAVFDAVPGTIIGPLKSDQGYHVIKVWALSRGKLSAQDREQIREVLFREWLDDRAGSAAVEMLI